MLGQQVVDVADLVVKRLRLSLGLEDALDFRLVCSPGGCGLCHRSPLSVCSCWANLQRWTLLSWFTEALVIETLVQLGPSFFSGAAHGLLLVLLVIDSLSVVESVEYPVENWSQDHANNSRKQDHAKQRGVKDSEQLASWSVRRVDWPVSSDDQRCIENGIKPIEPLQGMVADRPHRQRHSIHKNGSEYGYCHPGSKPLSRQEWPMCVFKHISDTVMSHSRFKPPFPRTPSPQPFSTSSNACTSPAPTRTGAFRPYRWRTNDGSFSNDLVSWWNISRSIAYN